MADPARLLEHNRAWAQRIKREQPGLIEGLAQGQAPAFLWIGCSDSRVQPATLTDTPPGELFVHRNIANAIFADDANAQAVVEYAVDALQVEHIVVCGHYGCGGIRACTRPLPDGWLGQWLANLTRIAEAHAARLDAIDDGDARLDRLAELNVIEQAYALTQNTTVQRAWARGQALSIHGWIYGLDDGLLRDLGATTTNAQGAEGVYRQALEALSA